jgi:hypothetical protein
MLAIWSLLGTPVVPCEVQVETVPFENVKFKIRIMLEYMLGYLHI